jgi:hypothetical protein
LPVRGGYKLAEPRARVEAVVECPKFLPGTETTASRSFRILGWGMLV